MNDLIIGVIIGVVLMFYLFEMRNKCKTNNNFNKHIQTLVRQAARWTTAAEQDENSMIAVLHANYGAGYLWALTDIATDQEIKQATGIDIKKFTKKITSVQDMVTKKMAKLCPKYAPSPTYLTKLSGENIA